MEATYVVAGTKPWNRRVFDRRIQQFPGQWHFVSSREQLDVDHLASLEPRYLFFLHWSWRVPQALIDRFECVCFHSSDVPYGRGGSPIQNLIQRGHKETQLTALRMCDELDAGPVYLKQPLSLEGSAEEILIRVSELSADMIRQIIQQQPEPQQQQGDAVVFPRRRPEQSEIPELASLEGLYDFIRMLDADTYPHAFLNYRGFRFEFRRAARYDGRIVADVTITSNEEPAA